MDDDSTAGRTGGTHPAGTVLRFLALTALAGLALPSAAWLVQRASDDAENWIFPLQLVLVGMVAVAYDLWRGARHRGATRGTGTRLLWASAATTGAVLLVDAVWLSAIAG